MERLPHLFYVETKQVCSSTEDMILFEVLTGKNGLNISCSHLVLC